MHKHLRYMAIAALAAVSSASFADPSQSLKGPRSIAWKDFLGVNAHFLWFEPVAYKAQMAKLKELGLQWSRIDMHWDRHEPVEGQFNLATMDALHQELQRQSIKSVAYLTGSAPFASTAPAGAPNSDQYPPRSNAEFAARLALFAQRYPGITAWQAWNEANIPTYWQPYEDPLAYGNLLQTSMDALKANVPSATRVMGGMAYYSQMPYHGSALMLQSLASQGQLKTDVVAAYHPYTNQPEGDDVAARDFVVHGTQMNSMLRSANVSRIWATEFGWSSYAGPQEMQPLIGEAGQADYTLRRLALMSAMDYDKVFLFALSDLDARASVRDRSYGLLTVAGAEKPVFKALKRFLAITGPTLTPAASPYFANAPAGMINVTWTRPDGKTVWIFWAAQDGSVTLPRSGQATLHDPMTGSATPVTAGASGFYVPVKKTMQVMVL